MAVFRILEQEQGDATFNIVLMDDQDVVKSTLAEDVPEGRLKLGRSLGSELTAAGVAEGVWWSPTVLFLDSGRVPEGTTRDQVVTVLIAHDPTDPAPEDSYITTMKALETEAQAILDANGNSSARTRDFIEAFLAWTANDVPR